MELVQDETVMFNYPIFTIVKVLVGQPLATEAPFDQSQLSTSLTDFALYHCIAF